MSTVLHQCGLLSTAHVLHCALQSLFHPGNSHSTGNRAATLFKPLCNQYINVDLHCVSGLRLLLHFKEGLFEHCRSMHKL